MVVRKIHLTAVHQIDGQNLKPKIFKIIMVLWYYSVAFGDLRLEAGLKALNAFLRKASYRAAMRGQIGVRRCPPGCGHGCSGLSYQSNVPLSLPCRLSDMPYIEG